jgi:hypothetical protein
VVQVAALKLTLGFNRDAFQRPLPELGVSGQRRSKLLLHPQQRRARDEQQGEGQAGKSDTVQQDMIIDDDDFTNQLESDKAIMSQQTLAGADRQFYNIVTTVFYTII